MRPVYSKAPPTNVRWALDVLNIRKFFAHDPADALNRARVFAIDGETTMTDEELVALHHLGKLTQDGVREFAAERRALMNAITTRRVTALRPVIRAVAPKRNVKPRK
jgi:cytochrome P450